VERDEHERVLQPLAAVDGEDLDAGGVGLESACLLVRRDGLVAGLGPGGQQPGAQRADTAVLVQLGDVEQLTDVSDVGEVAFAADGGQQPWGDLPLGEHDPFEPCDAVVGEHDRPAVRQGVEVVEVVVVRVGELGRGPADPAGQGETPDASGVARPLGRLEQPAPVVGRVRGEHAPDAVDDARDADLTQGTLDEPRLGVGAHEDGDVLGAEGVAVGADPDATELVEQGLGHVGGQPPADGRGARRLPVRCEHAQLERARVAVVVERAGPVVLGGADGGEVDVLTELGALEQPVERGQQGRVAPEVGRQAPTVVGGPGRLEVGAHVGAAEAVDGLLRVTDEHQRPARIARVAEGPLEDVPLHRVGVLELVDQRPPVALLEDRDGRVAAGGVPQGPPQRGQQIVVAEGAVAPLAGGELVAELAGEGDAFGSFLGGVVLAVDADVGVRVPVDAAGDGRRVRAGRARDVGRGEVAADVDVVGHLAEEGGLVLDQGDVAGDVRGQSDRAQDLLGEAVDGGDGRGIEVGDRGGEPFVPSRELLPVRGGERGEDLVVGIVRDGGAGEHGA
jgi:hypothetical protein